MNNKNFLAWLRKNNACKQAIDKVGCKTAQEVWETWENVKQLIWWIRESDILTKQETMLLACGIARNTPLADGRTVWDLLTDERSRNAIETAERWANGEATDEELEAAKTRARHAAEVMSDGWTASYAAHAAPTWTAQKAAEVVAWAAWSEEAEEEGGEAHNAAVAWQLAYIREQLPDFVERFTKANS